MAARKLAGCHVGVWEQLTEELDDLIEEEISGMEDQFFYGLKLSHDKKFSYIYCFIFPN